MDLVIFDLDGTLIDSEAIIIGAQVECFERHGLTYPGREAGLGVIGLTLDIALARLAGLPAPDAGLTESYRDIFNRMRREAEAGDPSLDEPLFPGVQAMLEALAERPGLKLGIATGKSRRGVDHILDRHGWRDLFATTQSSDDAPSKPHPGMILRAMAEVGAGPEASAMIGDATFDMEMAVAAGVTPIAVSWGFQPAARLMDIGARHLLTRAADLPLLIEQIGPAGA